MTEDQKANVEAQRIAHEEYLARQVAMRRLIGKTIAGISDTSWTVEITFADGTLLEIMGDDLQMIMDGETIKLA